jgi:hypothetical protein
MASEYDGINRRQDDLEKRVNEIAESLKEREVSFIRALATLIKDWQAYQKGDRSDFPKEAFLGAVYAYSRPRIAIAIGAFGALILGGLQVWLLVQQTHLLQNQNEIVDAQARSEEMSAVSSVLSTLAAGNPAAARGLAVAQLNRL